MSYSVFNQDGVHQCDIPLNWIKLTQQAIKGGKA